MYSGRRRELTPKSSEFSLFNPRVSTLRCWPRLALPRRGPFRNFAIGSPRLPRSRLPACPPPPAPAPREGAPAARYSSTSRSRSTTRPRTRTPAQHVLLYMCTCTCTVGGKEASNRRRWSSGQCCVCRPAKRWRARTGGHRLSRPCALEGAMWAWGGARAKKNGGVRTPGGRGHRW